MISLWSPILHRVSIITEEQNKNLVDFNFLLILTETIHRCLVYTAMNPQVSSIYCNEPTGV